MDKAYIPSVWEPIIKKQWADSNAFDAPLDSSRETFTVVLPPPNANGSLHAGHVMMVYQDIMCRYARLQGKDVLYIPGTDHAGFETQYVFEKHLAKKGESRFQYDRETLYHMIEEFVATSQGAMNAQLESVGFSLDWKKSQYTLDPAIIAVVYETFRKLFDAGLVYRANRLVNYCCKDGTSFSDLEVESTEQEGMLYHIRYALTTPTAETTHIVVATTRPETLFGDVAVMVNPKDTRYQSLIGASVRLPLTDRVIPIIADPYVDMAFGTGAVKVTPAHDTNDFEVAKRHQLWHDAIIGFNGKLQKTGTPFDGMKVKAAREAVVTSLTDAGLMEQIKPHAMVVKTCYKCHTVIEPLPLEQWFIHVRPLADAARSYITSGQVDIQPPRFKKILSTILDDFIDWNISRQTVWGIRIPAFHHLTRDEWKVELDAERQKELIASGEWIQDTDTFDTWFSSGQWPFATLISIMSTTFGVPPTTLYKNLETDHENPLGDGSHPRLADALRVFNRFYPLSVMETGYDIARAWVARMMMLGIFVTGKTPFHSVYMHGMVRDAKGQKMSKSKGNVINPLKLTDQYGSDALRAALIFGTTPGNDVNLSEEKVKGMRNFINKLWNIGRFISLMAGSGEAEQSTTNAPALSDTTHTEVLNALKQEFAALQKSYGASMHHYEFSQALQDVHEFAWHRFADYYIESLKEAAKADRDDVRATLAHIYLSIVTMLEPFTPFVAHAIKSSFSAGR